jgi:hypothetical protein
MGEKVERVVPNAFCHICRAWRGMIFNESALGTTRSTKNIPSSTLKPRGLHPRTYCCRPGNRRPGREFFKEYEKALTFFEHPAPGFVKYIG